MQEGSHPVVCISWGDAAAYVDWLIRKTGKSYRLLSEAEFEYAARARTSPGRYPRYWFGDDDKDLCSHANGGAGTLCNDGYDHTSPVGHYRAENAFRLSDMTGNAWQWTADCWHDNYNDARLDGSPWLRNCSGSSHVVRGGSWDGNPRNLRAALRDRGTDGDYLSGVRVARTLSP